MATDFNARLNPPSVEDSPWAVDPSRMDEIARLYPDMSPDAAYKAVSTGASSEQAQELALQDQRERYLANLQHVREEDRASENPVLGVLRTTSQVAGAALNAPKQQIDNAARLAAAANAGADTGTDTGGGPLDTARNLTAELFGNTDLSNLVQYGMTGDESLDPGDSWFGVSPDSNAAQAKLALDMKAAGQLAPNGSPSVSLTIGQRAMDTGGVPKDSEAYRIMSGLVDAASYAADPASYVGGGEVSNLIRLRRFGSLADNAAKGLPAAERIVADQAAKGAATEAFAKADSAAADLRAASAKRAETHDLLANTIEDFESNIRPRIQEARDAAGAAIVDHDTAVLRSRAASLQNTLDNWYQLKMTAKDSLNKVRADRRKAVRNAAKNVDTAHARLEDLRSVDGPAFDGGPTLFHSGTLPEGALGAAPESTAKGRWGQGTYASIERGVYGKEGISALRFGGEGNPRLYDADAPLEGAAREWADEASNWVNELWQAGYEANPAVLRAAIESPDATLSTVRQALSDATSGSMLRPDEIVSSLQTRMEEAGYAGIRARGTGDLPHTEAVIFRPEAGWQARRSPDPADIEAAGLVRDQAVSGLADVRDRYADAADLLTQQGDEAAGALRALDERTVRKAGSEADVKLRQAEAVQAQAKDALNRRQAILQSTLSMTDQRIAELQDARALHEAVGMEQVRHLAERFGHEVPKSVDDARDYVRSAAGLSTSLSGQDMGSLGKFVGYLAQKDTGKVLDVLAKVTDEDLLYDLSRGQWGAATLRALADAGTKEEVLTALASSVTRGEMMNGVRGLGPMRLATRAALSEQDPDKLAGLYGKAFRATAKATRWGHVAAKSNVPWNYARDVTDADGMVALVADSANYFGKGWRKTALGDVRSKYVRQMIRATDSDQRRLVWENFLSEATRTMMKAKGFTDEEVNAVRASLNKATANARKDARYTAEALAAAKGDSLFIDGKKIDNFATLESEMNNKVTSPDWKEFQRLLNGRRRVREHLAQSDSKFSRAKDLGFELSDLLFEQYWRTSVLAFRGGFIIRNLGDTQIRMLLNGGPSLFTAPFNIAAMAVSHHLSPTANSPFAKIVNRLRAGQYDAAGNLISKGDEALSVTDMVALDNWYQKIALRDVSRLDPGAPGHRWLDDGSVQYVGPQDRNFHKGWAKELGLLWNGPMSRSVLDLETGGKLPQLDAWVKQTGLTDRRAALVDFYWNGPGRKRLDMFLNESTAMRDVLDSPQALNDYFFGDSTVSLASRWERLTDGYSDDVVSSVRGLASKAAHRDMHYLERQLAQVRTSGAIKARVQDGTWNIDDVRVIGTPQGRRSEDALRGLRAATDWFFRLENTTAKNLAYEPEFLFAKHDVMSELIGALTPEDAAQVLRNVRKGLDGSLAPASWKNRTLRKYESAAKKASGDGTVTIGDIDRISSEYAVRENKRLFYDAMNRNAVGHAMRLVSPFAQAFVNTLRVWGRLAAKKSNRFYNADNLYRAGQGQGTNFFHDEPNNPEDAMFYWDDSRQQMMVSVPLVGSLIGLAASLRAGQGTDLAGAVTGDMPIQSTNMAFQNDLSPGGGPALTIPATYLEQFGWYQEIVPDGIKRSLVPFVQNDPERTQNLMTLLTPAWASDILGSMGVPSYTDRVTKYVPAAMSALFSKNPGKYLGPDGFMDQAGQGRLLQDANAFASGIGFARGVLQNSSAGSIMPQVLTTDKNGNTLSPYLLTQEFYDQVDSTGSRDQAFQYLIDRYGADVVLTLLPTRESGYTPTNDAWKFMLDNPDAASRYPSALSVLYPGGGYSAYLDRWNKQSGRNRRLTPGEIVQSTNSLLRSALEAENDRKLASGVISQGDWQAMSDQIADGYSNAPQASMTLGGRAVTISELQKAVQDPDWQSAPGSASTARYLALRDVMLTRAGGKSFTGSTKADIRAWLRNKGESIAAEDPMFAVAWAKVFSGEVAQ